MINNMYQITIFDILKFNDLQYVPLELLYKVKEQYLNNTDLSKEEKEILYIHIDNLIKERNDLICMR